MALEGVADGGDAGDGEDVEDDLQAATNEDEVIDALLNLHLVAHV